MSGYPSTQTLLEAANVDQVPLNSKSNASTSNGRHHIFESNEAEKGAVADKESTLPGSKGLHTLVEQTRRLAEVNVVGVAVSIATFVRPTSGVFSNNTKSIIRNTASPLIVNIGIPAHPPPFLRRRFDTSSYPCLVRRNQSRRIGVFQECGGGERRRTKRSEVLG